MSERFAHRNLLFLVVLLQTAVVHPPVRAAQKAGGGDSPLSPNPLRDSTGGWGCVLCTSVVAIVSQLRQLHQIPAREALGLYCGFFRSAESIVCKAASVILLEGVLRLIDDGRTPDKVCQAVKICEKEECTLFPHDKNDTFTLGELRSVYQLEGMDLLKVCGAFPALCGPLFQDVSHDKDGDKFSTYPTKRGTDWRGRDCNDSDAQVYPGRNTRDTVRDENCNGIYGVEESSGKTYEELWCGSSSPMGVIAVGDSVTADFGIPLGYTSVLDISSDVMADIIPMLDNEMDRPMLSSITGFANSTKYEPNVDGPMVSVYSKLVELNRCNHRDYQNLGHNGDASGNIPSLLQKAVRNRSAGVKPAYVFFSMVGNNVCTPPPNFPTPDDYYQDLTKALKQADELLPPGSYVLILSLVDARNLIGGLVDRVHPIGSLNNDVTYGKLYDYLNCLQNSPCWGWLNSNETVRNETWERAEAINAMIPRLVNESRHFENIKVLALGDVVSEAVSDFNGPLWKLVNPVDGFHPSQIAMAYIGAHIFSKMKELNIIPPENPFNNDIQRRFGDQGGY